MEIKVKILSFYLFIFLLVGITSAAQGLYFEIDSLLEGNSSSVSLILQTSDSAISGLDSYDFLFQNYPSLPSEGGRVIYSMIGAQGAIIDVWNAMLNPTRTLDLRFISYNGASSIGSLVLNWDNNDLDDSNGRYFFTLEDYGNNPSGSLVDSVNMRSDSSYSVNNLFSTRYFKIKTDYQYCGDSIKQSWEGCDGSDLGSASCSSLLGSTYSGNLSCSGSCGIITSGCSSGGGGGGGGDTCTLSCLSPSDVNCGGSLANGCATGCSTSGGTKCSDGKSCVAGTCIPPPIFCTDVCILGAKRCFGGGVQECIQPSNCTIWGTIIPCSLGETCSNGICLPCSDSCSSLGFECGNRLVCGQETSCGSCSEDENCISGQCVGSNQPPIDTLVPGESGSASIREGCTPNYQCDPWSECLVNYDSSDLLKGVSWFEGKRTRTCSDLNGCYLTIGDSEDCSLHIEIFLEKKMICGIEYTEVREKSTNKLLARSSDRIVGTTNLVDIFLLPEDSSDCDEEELVYKISFLDRLVFLIDFRNVWRLIK